jgi:hypothetical protein
MPQYALPTTPVFKFAHLTATGVVKAAPALLSQIIVNSASEGSIVTIFDNTAASGTEIGVMSFAAASGPVVFPYGIRTNTGLSISITGTTPAVDLTVVFN